MNSPNFPITAEAIDAFGHALGAIIDQRVARIAAKLQTPGRGPYLTVDGASAYLGITKEAVRGLIKRGELPAYRPNGRVFLRISDLDDWVESEARLTP